MKIFTKKITLEELKKMAEKTFGDLVKVVVDVEKEIIAVDGELHADEETLLINSGSKQENLWGINLYPKKTGEDFIEFDSMINLRPAYGNNSRGIDDLKIREKIIKIVDNLIIK
ncbi:MAG: DUF5674 family protein [Patescibacteria group bacterium]|nr:DUF5674 family protein [Patescibacteria group bacterium]